MRRKTILLGILFCIFLSQTMLYCQSTRKNRKALWNSENNYEVTIVATGTDGTKLLKVWGYGKKVEDAIVDAKKQAVAACIFKGAVGNRADVMPPIIPQPNDDIAEQYADFFNNFFETGGDYLKYVNMSDDAYPTGTNRLKHQKGYKVGVVVSVAYDNLRKYLEEKGIIQKLGEQLSGAAKPTVMFVPADNYCFKNGYVMTFNSDLGTEEIADYKKALQRSSELLLVIGKLNTMMTERGFPVKDLEAEMKKVDRESAEMHAMQSSSSGASIQESPLDILRRTADADILIQVGWDVNKTGPKNSVTFNLRGIDSYTSKQIAGAQGTGTPSLSAEVPLLLEEAVLVHIDNFNKQLQAFFDDAVKNGREVTVKVKIWDNAMINLEDEYSYKGNTDELRMLIEDWVADNTIKGVYNLGTTTETQMNFENVRIPVYYEKSGRQRAMNTKVFVDDLRKFLQQAPFHMESKVYQRGLGEAWIILGEK